MMEGWGKVQDGSTTGLYHDLYNARGSSHVRGWGGKAYWCRNIRYEYPTKMSKNVIDYSKAVVTKDISDPTKLQLKIRLGANKMNRNKIKRIGSNLNAMFGNHIASVFSSALPGYAPQSTVFNEKYGTDNMIFNNKWTESGLPINRGSGSYDFTVVLKNNLTEILTICEKKKAMVSQMGDTIDGQAAGDNFGYSMAMNGAGNRIIGGAPFQGHSNRGSARIFEYKDAAWTQLGNTLEVPQKLNMLAGQQISTKQEIVLCSPPLMQRPRQGI